VDELERIDRRYRERDADASLAGFWSLRNPAVLHAAQERERRVLQLLAAEGLGFEGRRVLDVGCGRGTEFANLLRWGAPAGSLVGIDLMHARLAEARTHGGVLLAQASATRLPFADAAFDAVVQNVVFSSIVDAATRRVAAAEMRRVLRPGGFVLWYDAFRTRSTDPHFRAVPRAEVGQLFPDLRWRFATLTSDIGIAARAQRLAGAGVLPWLDALRLLRTNLLGVGVFG